MWMPLSVVVPADRRRAYPPLVPKDPTTDRIRAFYERLAPRYDRGMRMSERLMSVEGGRKWVTARAAGDVLEIGVGTGLNLPFYAPDVRLTGIDLSAAMLSEARKRADSLGLDMDLCEGNAEALEFSDGQFDTVIFSLCLCSIPDDRKAVAEGVRVLKSGGRLLLLEHVRSPSRVVRTGQRMIEPLTLRFQADHLTREPLTHVVNEGLEVEEVHRWAWGIMERASAVKS
jgi:ubiquinone/menaquinone biosynthesis C-methylase UbiE